MAETFHPDLPAVGFDNTFDQGEAQARTGPLKFGFAGAVMIRVIDPEKLIKNTVVELRVDANAIVGNHNLNRRTNFVYDHRPALDSDQTAIGGVLDGVVDQVFKGLDQAGSVGFDN